MSSRALTVGLPTGLSARPAPRALPLGLLLLLRLSRPWA